MHTLANWRQNHLNAQKDTHQIFELTQKPPETCPIYPCDWPWLVQWISHDMALWTKLTNPALPYVKLFTDSLEEFVEEAWEEFVEAFEEVVMEIGNMCYMHSGDCWDWSSYAYVCGCLFTDASRICLHICLKLVFGVNSAPLAFHYILSSGSDRLIINIYPYYKCQVLSWNSRWCWQMGP